MSHRPRRYFVVVLHNDTPRSVKGSNGARIVPTDRTLEQVVAQRNLGGAKPLLGWRTLAGAEKHRDRDIRDWVRDRIHGYSIRIYERRGGKLEPLGAS